MQRMTKQGKLLYKQVIEYKLSEYFDPCMGNFQFNENELFENMNKILMWLEDHQDYCLISQKGYIYDDNIDAHWFLTPQNTL